MAWPCILLTATDQVSLSLRRYAAGACAAHPYGMSIHDARILIMVVPSFPGWDAALTPPPQGDPRWPNTCACGYQFQDGDAWQLGRDRLHIRQDTGELLTLRDARSGMMWDAPWYLNRGEQWAGPDGRCLMVKLPDGNEWIIDGPGPNGKKWTRTGEPPCVTVCPSIVSGRYHGWLIAGVLSDDLAGRSY